MSDDIYEKFLCAPGMRLEAHERISAIHHANMLQRLDRIEDVVERIEKRLWLTVYGVVAVILSQAVKGVLLFSP